MSIFHGSRIPESQNLLSLVDAGSPRTASSGNINDLVYSGMSWTRSSGSYPMNNDTQNGVACWNMDTGYIETSTRLTLGQNYTLFYLWKPRLNDSGWRTMHRGDSDHWGIIQDGTINLGMYSNRNGGFRDSGYDITRDVWQTWIIVGTGNSATSDTGTSRHYVNGVDVGTSDRVGSGTNTYRVGWTGQGPGKIAVAGILNNTAYNASQAKLLHNSLFARV